MNESIVIKTGRELDILADATFPENKQDLPIVIFCHGYKGFKDWGAWNLVAQEFSKQGFFFLKFNFSHNGGTLKNPIDFPDLEAFGKNTYSLEVSDLITVIDFIIEKNKFSPFIDISKISLIGHSRGGGIVTLVGAKCKGVKIVISWAGVSDYTNRFPKGEGLKNWKETGVYYIMNGRTLQKMPHYYTFYQDFLENKSILDIKKAASSLGKNHLIIHGKKDEAVSVSEALEIAKANPDAELQTINEAGHTFGSSHPWLEMLMPLELTDAVNKSIIFIKKSFSK